MTCDQRILVSTSRIAPWLFPATYAIHLAEEYFAGGGFLDWAARVLDIRIGVAEFLAWNIAGLALTCAAAFLVSRHSLGDSAHSRSQRPPKVPKNHVVPERNGPSFSL